MEGTRERVVHVKDIEMNTNGGDEGDKWKQVDRDQQGSDQAVPVQCASNGVFFISYCFETHK